MSGRGGGYGGTGPFLVAVVVFCVVLYTIAFIRVMS